MTIAHLHERSYRQYADRPAVLSPERVVTYRELGDRVHRLIGGLIACGMAPRERGVILLDNCEKFFEIDQALFVGGFVRVALSPRLHAREIRHILEDCTAHTLFTTSAQATRLHDSIADLGSLKLIVSIDAVPDSSPSPTGSPNSGTPRARVDGLDEPLPDAGVAAETSTAVISLAELESTGKPESPATLPDLDAPAALLYTSGTTGAPKGATLTHRNWLAQVRNCMIELPPARLDDVVLHVAPLSHLSGYLAPVYWVRGAAHLPVARFDATAALELINRHEVTILPLVPTILNLLTLAAEERGGTYPSLASIVYAGSPIAPDRLVRARAVFGDVFTQFYGLSETPMPLTCLSAADHRIDDPRVPPPRLASAGRPNPLAEVIVRGPQGEQLGPGEVGEIAVRGDTTMIGYWNRPEVTAEMIDADGWARTGDLGRFDDEGYLYLVDRIKDMIVSGGYNIYPTEVESAIATLPAVQEVAVIGVPDDRWGEAVMAFIVLRENHTHSEQEIVEACTSQLADYKKPRQIRFVPELPKTASGKLRKRDLRSGYWSEGRRVGG